MSGEHAIDRVVDSTAAKLIKLVVPLLLGVVGFFLLRTLNKIEDGQTQQGNDIGQIRSDLRVVNTRLDEGVIRRIEDNARETEELRRRVYRLEQLTSR